MKDQERREKLLRDAHPRIEFEASLERRVLMSIDRQRRQVQRMKTAIIIAWGLLLLLLAGGGIVEALGLKLLASTLAVVARGALLLALVLTASWYYRSVSLQFDSVRQALAAIQDRLKDLPSTKDHPS